MSLAQRPPPQAGSSLQFPAGAQLLPPSDGPPAVQQSIAGRSAHWKRGSTCIMQSAAYPECSSIFWPVHKCVKRESPESFMLKATFSWPESTSFQAFSSSFLRLSTVDASSLLSLRAAAILAVLCTSSSSNSRHLRSKRFSLSGDHHFVLVGRSLSGAFEISASSESKIGESKVHREKRIEKGRGSTPCDLRTARNRLSYSTLNCSTILSPLRLSSTCVWEV